MLIRAGFEPFRASGIVARRRVAAVAVSPRRRFALILQGTRLRFHQFYT
jgi:hypothetical protein